MKLYWFNDTCWNMEDREERRRERANRERCKEVPRGSISPASEHINRSQPYYSQSKADENRKKIHWKKRGNEQRRREKIPRIGPLHVNLACDKKTRSCSVKHVSWSLMYSEANEWAKLWWQTGASVWDQLCSNKCGVITVVDTVRDTMCNIKAIYREDFSHLKTVWVKDTTVAR